jgi:hypothetical protein
MTLFSLLMLVPKAMATSAAKTVKKTSREYDFTATGSSRVRSARKCQHIQALNSAAASIVALWERISSAFRHRTLQKQRGTHVRI